MLPVDDELVAGSMATASGLIASTCSLWQSAPSTRVAVRGVGLRLRGLSSPGETGLTDLAITSFLQHLDVAVLSSTTQRSEPHLGADLLFHYQSSTGDQRVALFQAKVVEINKRGRPYLRHGLEAAHLDSLRWFNARGVPSFVLLYLAPPPTYPAPSHLSIKEGQLVDARWPLTIAGSPDQFFHRYTAVGQSAAGAVCMSVNEVKGPIPTSAVGYRNAFGDGSLVPWEFAFPQPSPAIGAVLPSRAADTPQFDVADLIGLLAQQQQRGRRRPVTLVSLGARSRRL